MSGRVHWLRDLDAETYHLDGERILIERTVFESIGDYTRSAPTGPGPGRVYRKNLDWRHNTPDNWWVYVCEQDPEPDYVLHRPYRVELVDDPDPTRMATR